MVFVVDTCETNRYWVWKWIRCVNGAVFPCETADVEGREIGPSQRSWTEKSIRFVGQNGEIEIRIIRSDLSNMYNDGIGRWIAQCGEMAGRGGLGLKRTSVARRRKVTNVVCICFCSNGTCNDDAPVVVTLEFSERQIRK